MNRSFNTLIVAILILVFITSVSWTVQYGHPWPNRQGAFVNAAASVLDLEPGLELSKLSGDFYVGSVVPLAQFTLKSRSEYTLRYLAFDIEATGLDDRFFHPKSFTLYALSGQERTVVGYGESFQEGLLRIRLEPQPGFGYLGNAGSQSFLLIGPVFKASHSDSETSAEEVHLSLRLSEKAWAWLPGHYTGAWITAPEPLSSEQILGLPSLPLEKTL